MSSKPKGGRWLADIFEHLPDPVILRANNGVILHANGAFGKLAGVPVERVFGKDLLDLMTHESRERWTRDLDKLSRGDWTMAVSAYDRIDGRSVPVEVRLIGRTSFGRRQAEILHFQDISVYCKIERALAASQTQWDLSFDAIPDLMCILDGAGRILRGNRAMTQAFQKHHSDLTGMDYRTVFMPFSPRRSKGRGWDCPQSTELLNNSEGTSGSAQKLTPERGS